MIAEFGFQLNTRMFYGIGYSRKLGRFLKDMGYGHVVFLTDEGVAAKSDYYREIKGIVQGGAESFMEKILRGTEEPDYDYLDEVAAEVRSMANPDVIVGIGGGSCLDMMKAVAALMTNPGRGIDYRGFDKLQTPGVPTIAIPATAGTGSEVTINAVFTDKKEMKKLGINGLYMNATYAILDAEWTLSCPVNVAVSSGMDAMTHTIESFSCNKTNGLTRTFSREAFRLLYGALPSLIDDPRNKTKRQELLLGSYLAGAALFNSGSGIAGALSYPIGVHFKVPHGIGGAVFLSSVIEFNVGRGYYDYADLLDLIEPCSGLSVKGKAERFSSLMRGLSEKMGVPKFLEQWGITKENVKDVAAMTLPLQAAFDQNPVAFSADTDAKEMMMKHVRP